MKQIDLSLTRMGIKANSESSQSANAITLAELEIPDVLKRVVAVVYYPHDEMLTNS